LIALCLFFTLVSFTYATHTPGTSAPSGGTSFSGNPSSRGTSGGRISSIPGSFSSASVALGVATAVAGTLNTSPGRPPGTSYTASVSRTPSGGWTANVNAVQAGGGNRPGGNSTTGGSGTPGGSAICLPDLIVGALSFSDGSGTLYAPTSIPANVSLTPQVTFTNQRNCATNYSGTYRVNQYSGSQRNLMIRQATYQSWRTVGTNTNGSYPVRLNFVGLGYNNTLNGQGPTAAVSNSTVNFPPVTFTTVGTQAVTIVADDPAACPGNPVPSNGVPWSGCISEEGIFFTQVGNQGVVRALSGTGNEGNNTANRTLTIVATAIPVTSPQCSDGIDNADPEDATTPLADTNDPGCHTDSNASNPASYSPSDNDETDPPVPPQCSDSGDNDGDTIIDFPADPGCSSATDNDETDPPIITANGQSGTITIRSGTPTTIAWDNNGNTGCTLSTPLPGGTATTGTQIDNPTSESTYTINCTQGSASVTVKVLPVVQET
jgi:hypothetical protein